MSDLPLKCFIPTIEVGTAIPTQPLWPALIAGMLIVNAQHLLQGGPELLGIPANSMWGLTA